MKSYHKYIYLLVLPLLLHSCLAVKEYERPEVFTEEPFATSQLPQDSISVSQIPWREIFTDPALQSYIARALDNNNDIRIALQNIEQSRAFVAQGRAAYYPTLSVGANYTHTVNSKNTQIGRILGRRQHLDQTEVIFNLGWEADIWGKITSQRKANEATYLQSVAAHQAVKTQLISMVASTYFQLMALDEQKAVAEKTIANREQSVETNKALKDAGIVTEVAVKQTEALLLNAEALLLDITNDTKIMENAFSILLGEFPQNIQRNTLNEQQIPMTLEEGVPAQLINNRPDVIAAEMSFRNAFELTNVAKASFYPTLRLTASGGVQSIDFPNLFDPSSLFGNVLAGLTQPIFNQRQIRTQYEMQLSVKEIAYLNYKQAIIEASQEVSDALYTYQANKAKEIIKQKEADTYNTAVAYSEELLNHGMANYIEVLTAKENAMQAELSVVNTNFAKLNALIQLYKALGGGVN